MCIHTAMESEKETKKRVIGARERREERPRRHRGEIIAKRKNPDTEREDRETQRDRESILVMRRSEKQGENRETQRVTSETD